MLFDVVGLYSNISYSDVLSHSSSLLDMCHDKTVSSSMLLKLMEIIRDESLQWISFIIKNLEQLLVPAGPLDAYISYGCLKYQILEHLGYKLFCGYVI